MRHTILGVCVTGLLLAACGPSGSVRGKKCEQEGQVGACTCPSGATGTQTCGASKKFGVCQCEGNTGNADTVSGGDSRGGGDVITTPDKPAVTTCSGACDAIFGGGTRDTSTLNCLVAELEAAGYNPRTACGAAPSSVSGCLQCVSQAGLPNAACEQAMTSCGD